MTLPLEYGKRQAGLVTYISQDNFVYCQLDTDEAYGLNDLSEKIGQLVHANRIPARLEVGVQCLAHSGADGVWYRSVITKVSGSEVTVYYVDYGNSEVLDSNNLCDDLDELFQTPYQAIQCVLSDFMTSSASSTHEYLQEVLLEKEVQFVVLSRCPDHQTAVKFVPCYNVAMYSDTTSAATISATMVEKGLGQLKLCIGRVQVGKQYKCYLSFSDSPGKFWVQFSYQYEDLVALMGKLNSPDSEQALQTLPQAHIVPGAVCCCLFSDDNKYYRAEVVSISSSDIVVQIRFIDYGNFSSVKLSEVKALPAQFCVSPPFAVQCCLKGIKPLKLSKPHPKLGNIAWTKEVCEKFQSLVEQVELDVIIEKEIFPEIFSVILFHPEKSQDVGQLLCDMKCAEFAGASSSQVSPSSILSLPAAPAPILYTYLTLDVKKAYRNLLISHAESPDIVWCQPGSDHLALEALSLILEKEGPNFPRLSKVEVDQPCCVKYAIDNSWCRGCIQDIAISQNIADVLYVDFGNVDSINLADIRALPSKYLSLPAQAVSFSMAGITPRGGDAWSKEAAECFKELVINRQLNCKTIGHDDDGYPSAILYDPLKKNRKISLELIDRGYACVPLTEAGIKERLNSSSSQQSQKSRNTSFDGSSRSHSRSSSYTRTAFFSAISLEMDQSVDGLVSQVEFPNKFYVQRIEAAIALEQLSQQVLSYSNSPEACPIQSLHVNLPVLAKFTGDDCWYRALVLKIQEKGKCLVKFVDFGNNEEVMSSSLLELPVKLMQLPMQAIPCSLYNLKPINRFPTNFINAFGEVVMEKNFQVVVRSLRKRERSFYEVDLVSLKGVNVAQELCSQPTYKDFFGSSNAYQTTTVKVPLLQLPLNKEVQVVISYAYTPGNFFVQLAERADSLSQLSDKLNGYFSERKGEGLSDIQVGSFCAAQFNEDKLWYRARVTHLNGSKVTVSYIDFGNSEDVELSSLKVLPKDMAEDSCFAVACTLVGITGNMDISQQSIDNFLLLNGQALFGVFQFGVASNDATVPIKLLKVAQSGEKKDVYKDLFGIKTNSILSSIESSTPTINSLVDCYLSYVVSPAEFFCQLGSGYEGFQVLMEELNMFYGDNKDGSPLQPAAVGSLCAVLFTDERWYRGKVMAISQTRATIYYFDYGNTEEVDPITLRALESKFCGLRAQAVRCCLANVEPVSGSEWPSESSEELQELILDVPVQVHFLSHSEVTGYNINMSYEGADIGSNLIEKKLAKERTTGMVLGGLTEPLVIIDTFPLRRGSKYHVIVTYVVSPEEVYCQVIDPNENLDILLQEVAQHCARATGVCNKKWQPGNFALGLFSEDKVWYRCVVRGVKENGTKYDVFYLDYGNTETVSRMSLLPISSDFCTLPARAIKCRLDGAQSYKCPEESLEEFRNLLLNNEFNMTCISIAGDSCCTVQLHDFEGMADVLSLAIERNILHSSMSTPSASQPGNQLFVQTFPSNVGIDTYHDVQVVFVESPSNFFCNFLSCNQDFQKMIDNFQDFYANLSIKRSNQKSWQPGRFVAAQFSEDDQWYRALILSVECEGAKVLFVDYGNEDVISFSRIRELFSRFTSIAAQAVPCSLAEVSPSSKNGWSDEAIEFFNSLCVDQPCIAQIKTSTDLSKKHFDFSDGQRLVVSLISSVNSKNLAEELTSAGHAISCVAADSTMSPTCSFLQPKLHPGDTFDVYVSFAVSPSRFWLQLAKNEDSISTIQNNLDAICSDSPAKPLVKRDLVPGMSCSAKYSEDKRWYRGVITNAKTSGIEVYFVDYGNTEVVPTSDVRVLQSELQAWEVQSFCCSLSNCHPVGSQWSEGAAGVFTELTADKQLKAHIISRVKSDYWEVRLEESGADICDQLVQSGVVTLESKQQALQPVPSIEKVALIIGQVYPVYIAFIDSPSRFYCQLTAGNDHLESLMARVADFYNGNVLEPLLEEGAYCVAQYSSNCAWYRAQILSVLSDEVLVYFIDYGNSEVVAPHQVMALEARFAELPAQAIICSLVHDTDAPLSDDVVARFNEYDLSFEFSIRIVSVHGEGQYVVELLESEEHISESVLNAELRVPPSAVADYQPIEDGHTEPVSPLEPNLPITNYFPLKYAPGENVDAFVSYVNSPTSFFCQPLQQSGELDDMMTEIGSYISSQESTQVIPKDRFKSGTVCLGQFTEDNDWYRVVIEEVISGTTALVSFVDYGNKEVLSSNRISDLPAQFSQLPLQAFHCSLFDSTADDMTWNMDQVEQFRALVPESDQVTITVLRYNQETCQHHVTITKNGQPIDVTFLLEQNHTVDSNMTNVGTRQPYQFEGTNISVVAQILSEQVSGSENAESESDDESEGKPLIKGPFKLSLAVQEVLDISVVYVEDPSLIYIQRADCETELTQLAEEIAQYCSNIEKESQICQTFCMGDFVLARWCEDGLWYRGEVLGTDMASEEKSSRISFIDYGNVEVISSDSLVMCPRNFLELPAQAIPCCLSQVPHRESWPILYRDIISELVMGKVLKASVVLPGSQGMKPTVKLEDLETSKDISQLVLDKLQEECEGGSSTTILEVESEAEDEHRQSANNIQEKQTLEKSNYAKQELDQLVVNHEGHTSIQKNNLLPSLVLPERNRDSFPIGSTHQAFIVCCPTLNSFSCQLLNETVVLDNITAKLAEIYDESDSLLIDDSLLQVGTYVAAQFQENMAWYRGKIIDCETSGTFQIRYIDFGNTESLSTDFIRNLDQSLATYPEIALECSLSGAGFLPEESSFSPAAASMMIELVGEEECLIEIVSHDKSVYHVAVSSQGEDVLDQLVKANMCMHSGTKVIPAPNKEDAIHAKTAILLEQLESTPLHPSGELAEPVLTSKPEKKKEITALPSSDSPFQLSSLSRKVDSLSHEESLGDETPPVSSGEVISSGQLPSEPSPCHCLVEDKRPEKDLVMIKSISEKTVDNMTTIRDEPVEEKAIQDEPVEDKSTMQDESVEDRSTMQDEPVEEKAVQDEPVVNKSTMQGEPIEDRSTMQDEPVEEKAVQDEPVEDKSIIQGEPIEDRSTMQDEPVEEKAVQDEPVEDKSIIQGEPVEDRSNMQNESVEDRSTMQDESVEDRSIMPQNEPVANKPTTLESDFVEDKLESIPDPTTSAYGVTDSSSQEFISVETPSKFATEYLYSDLKVGCYYSVKALNASSLEDFTCILMTHEEELKSLMTELSSYDDEMEADDQPDSCGSRPAMPVCCFSNDSQWCRGLVLGQAPESPDRYRVLHVDYGTVEVYCTDQIKRLKKCCAEKLSPLAIRCKFPILLESDISPGLPSSMDPWELEWPPSCLNQFNNIVKNCNELRMEIVKVELVQESTIYSVKLFQEDDDLRKILVTQLIERSKGADFLGIVEGGSSEDVAESEKQAEPVLETVNGGRNTNSGDVLAGEDESDKQNDEYGSIRRNTNSGDVLAGEDESDKQNDEYGSIRRNTNSGDVLGGEDERDKHNDEYGGCNENIPGSNDEVSFLV